MVGGAISQITRCHVPYDLGTHLQQTSSYFYKPLMGLIATWYVLTWQF